MLSKMLKKKIIQQNWSEVLGKKFQAKKNLLQTLSNVLFQFKKIQMKTLKVKNNNNNKNGLLWKKIRVKIYQHLECYWTMEFFISIHSLFEYWQRIRKKSQTQNKRKNVSICKFFRNIDIYSMKIRFAQTAYTQPVHMRMWFT